MTDQIERLMRTRMEDIKPNHAERYKWALAQLKLLGCPPGGTVLDAACGVGYGSVMLADAGYQVIAIDRSPVAAKYQAEFFPHPNVKFIQADLRDCKLPFPLDGAVSIETVEHIPDDAAWLRNLRSVAPRLIVTVPNQKYVPFNPTKNMYHFRHYTEEELTIKLLNAGFIPQHWATQQGKYNDKAEMRPGAEGLTLGVSCT